MAVRKLGGEPHVPKHQRVLETLTRDILAGKYKPGQRIPSETALVQQFGTSRITIGHAIGELARRGIVERIAGSGTYVRRRTRAGATFGLLIPNLGETEVFEPICRGIAGAPQARDCALLWGHSGAEIPRVEQALQLCDEFITREVSGVFFAPLEGDAAAGAVNLEIVGRLEGARIPIVLLDRCFLPYPLRSRYDLAGIDNRLAGYLATEHLLKLGAKRVAFLGYLDAAPTVTARLAGYREALLANGRASESNSVQRPRAITPAEMKAMHQATRADAYVCANDRTAAEVMRTLTALGHQVPDEVRIVGIDDVEYASLLPVPLTTVRQPCREIGEAAIGAMLERMARPQMLARDIRVECRLVIRRSCGS